MPFDVLSNLNPFKSKLAEPLCSGSLSHRAQKKQRVDNVIETLGLPKCRNTLIGEASRRAIACSFTAICWELCTAYYDQSEAIVMLIVVSAHIPFNLETELYLYCVVQLPIKDVVILGFTYYLMIIVYSG